MAKLLLDNSEMVTVTPDHGSRFKMDEIYNMLRCTCISYVQLTEGRTLIVDQEGVCKEKPRFNSLATSLAKDFSTYKNLALVGHVLMCKDEELPA